MAGYNSFTGFMMGCRLFHDLLMTMSFSLHLFDGHRVMPLEGSLYRHRWDTNKWPILYDPVPWSTPKREVAREI